MDLALDVALTLAPKHSLPIPYNVKVVVHPWHPFDRPRSTTPPPAERHRENVDGICHLRHPTRRGMCIKFPP